MFFFYGIDVYTIHEHWDLPELLFHSAALSEKGFWVWTVISAFLCIVLPYLIGSINPAVMISKRIYRDDVRNHGSGNAGSTNMLRTYGGKAAAITFGLDLGKAAVAVVLGELLWGFQGAAIAGFFVVFGHMFPVFYGFRGGKGVACLAMVVLLESPITFLILLGIFLVIAIGTRFVSLASVMCALLMPLILNAFKRGFPMLLAMMILSAVFVALMHRQNLKRLWSGTESKLDLSKFQIFGRGKK